MQSLKLSNRVRLPWFCKLRFCKLFYHYYAIVFYQYNFLFPFFNHKFIRWLKNQNIQRLNIDTPTIRRRTNNDRRKRPGQSRGNKHTNVGKIGQTSDQILPTSVTTHVQSDWPPQATSQPTDVSLCKGPLRNLTSLKGQMFADHFTVVGQ